MIRWALSRSGLISTRNQRPALGKGPQDWGRGGQLELRGEWTSASDALAPSRQPERCGLQAGAKGTTGNGDESGGSWPSGGQGRHLGKIVQGLEHAIGPAATVVDAAISRSTDTVRETHRSEAYSGQRSSAGLSQIRVDQPGFRRTSHCLAVTRLGFAGTSGLPGRSSSGSQRLPVS